MYSAMFIWPIEFIFLGLAYWYSFFFRFSTRKSTLNSNIPSNTHTELIFDWQAIGNTITLSLCYATIVRATVDWHLGIPNQCSFSRITRLELSRRFVQLYWCICINVLFWCIDRLGRLNIRLLAVEGEHVNMYSSRCLYVGYFYTNKLNLQNTYKKTTTVASLSRNLLLSRGALSDLRRIV